VPEPTWTITRAQLARAIAMAGVHRSENSAADQILAHLAKDEPAPLKIPDDMVLVHRGTVLTVTGTLAAFLPDLAAYAGPVDLRDFLEASDELRAAAGAAVTGE
jgi:hypothetical protein